MNNRVHTFTVAIRPHVNEKLEAHLKAIKDRTLDPYPKARFISEAIMDRIAREEKEGGRRKNK